MEWPEAKLARLVKVLGAISQDGLAISGGQSPKSRAVSPPPATSIAARPSSPRSSGLPRCWAGDVALLLIEGEPQLGRVPTSSRGRA